MHQQQPSDQRRCFPALARLGWLLFALLTGCAAPSVVEPSLPDVPVVVAAPTPTATIAPTATATIAAAATPTRRVPTATATPTPTTALPATTPAPPTAIVAQPTPTLPTLDENGRAALFDQVWDLVANHYLYADWGGVDWVAAKERYRPAALAADTPAQFYDALAGMVDELRDHHSRFENPQETFKRQAQASGTDVYVGVGILTVPIAEGLLVTGVYPGSAAAEAGIQRRDIIVTVDGQPVDGSNATISGPDGSIVALEVFTPGGEQRVINVQRRAVVAQLVPEAYLLPDTRIGYLLLPTFWADDTIDRSTAAIERLLADNGRLDGLIVDLRGNGGGWRYVLEGLLANFASGEVGSFYNARGSTPLTITSGPLYDQLLDVPLVVLVDRDTESYAEVFAAALQASGRADVVGVNTAGNTETIFAYDLSDGSRLWVAQEGFKLPDGANLEGRGVLPDRSISVDWARFSERRDPHINKAIELILNQRAGAK
jgi:carboxyl-terminal processing protease